MTLVPGVSRPESLIDTDDTSRPSVVPNYLPPSNVSPKTLPPMRLVQDDLDVTRLLGKVIENAPLTLPQLANAIGVTRQTLYNAKKGRSKVSLQWFLRLCNAAGARLYIALPRK